MCAPPLKSAGKRAVKLLVIVRPAMPTTPHSPAAATRTPWFFRAGLGWACALIALLAGGGCTTHRPPVVAYVPQVALVTVENHTDWPWRIAFVRVENPAASPPSTLASSTTTETPPAPAGLPWVALAPRETRRLDLAGGIYRVHRELLRLKTDPQENPPTNDPAAPTSLWLVPGRSYTWPLATLFSTEEGSQ